MFGHLKAQDFVYLMEGTEPPARQRAHLDACASCRATWDSVRSVRAEVSSMDTDIPEPDWAQFRSSVRDQLLSRSIQRESAVRRWTGWAIRPAAAWALSVFLAVGLTTVTVLWQVEKTSAPRTTIESTAVESAGDVIEAGPERSLFDDVVALGDEEQEQLRQMLESAQRGSPARQ